MNNTTAGIITIGDELLIGQVIDTNSAFIAQELNKAGIAVTQRIAVGDHKQAIVNALNTISEHNDIILITGGLGPTADDITKPLLCEYFGGKMVMHQPTLEFITHLFEQVLKRPMIERNAKQAEVPDVCTVLKNDKGTAPGMLFEKEGKIFVAMPGVPHEMKWIVAQHVIPIIQQKFKPAFIEHRTLLTAGIGESFLAELIKDWENQLPQNLKLAYLPNYGMVRLRLTGTGPKKEKLNTIINHQFALLKQYVQDYLVIDEDIPLDKAVLNLLVHHNKTVSTAESCTGGQIAASFASHAGASKAFKGSLVAYHNTVKENLLHVPKQILETVGAVSKETVEQMAKEANKIFNTDYAVAVSGIMGPDGGTQEKPVGLVWIAVANNKAVQSKSFEFKFDRDRNIHLTKTNALNMLRTFIHEKENSI